MISGEGVGDGDNPPQATKTKTCREISILRCQHFALQLVQVRLEVTSASATALGCSKISRIGLQYYRLTCALSDRQYVLPICYFTLYVEAVIHLPRVHSLPIHGRKSQVCVQYDN